MSWHNFVPGQRVARDEVIQVCNAYIRSGKVKNPQNKISYLEEFRNSPHDVIVYTPQGSGWGNSPLNPNNWRGTDGSFIWERKVIPKRTQTDTEGNHNMPPVGLSDQGILSPTQVKLDSGSESLQPDATLSQVAEPEGDVLEDIPSEDQVSGAGFGSPEINKAVEASAVQHVIQLYESSGWTVISVETEKCGFDLVCKKESREEHVEVKGTRGTEQSFIITAGEVRKAKEDSLFVLCLVNSALSDNPFVSKYSRSELASHFRLEALAYKAVPK
ncbi:protein NO VEIN domain-containing protein [Desulforhabdus amnigena]|jgi:hypothetical protein|uniref:Protein NO VEIN C-terminal domain-containing protein n=1 Tax=Desulforhabdus amnigena TaxID=40218 RepID=A0A9W6CWQ1_9BACT|nr:DUF3883 domain-containing protein [Desulforhabdus amnigena]NLJ29707.1 DUF3883 domain-containing protein [Deltaproteobacteria bacterium]GLI33974.1 hypothetical protein DAMNIGENAA_14070 [Desulforhabdus amnigena]